MALATLPPATEIVQAFRSDWPGYNITNPWRNLSEPYWANFGLVQPSWKVTALWKISNLRAVGGCVSGLGDLLPSDRAVTELHNVLSTIQIQSLPLPTVAPISGGAIFLSWKNGAKSVEVTAYRDGEVLLEGVENQDLNEKVSQRDIAGMLDWLVEG